MSGRVLITGATSGIGLHLALDYRRAGWQVWGCGRDGERLQELGLHGITPLQFDARDLAAMSGVAATLPSLDLLILNAGNCEYMDVGDGFDSELFARVIDTNLTATGHALAAFLPLLGAGSRLAIVSSSVSWLPLPRAEAYGARRNAGPGSTLAGEIGTQVCRLKRVSILRPYRRTRLRARGMRHRGNASGHIPPVNAGSKFPGRCVNLSGKHHPVGHMPGSLRAARADTCAPAKRQVTGPLRGPVAQR